MRLLPALLALVMAVPGLALPGAEAPPQGGITLIAAPAQSGTVHPGENLAISLNTLDSSANGITAPVATVYLDRKPIRSQSELKSWLHPEPESLAAASGTPVLQQPLVDLLRGETRTDSLVVPSAALGLDGQPWSVHRLSVRLSSGQTVLAEAHSAIVWYPPDAPVSPTGVAVVMPTALPAESAGLLDASLLGTYTAPDGILDRQLRQAINRQVAIAIDPRIIASIRILGRLAPPTATAWLARLEAADNQTFALTYADSDISALAQAGGTPPLKPISFAIDPSRFAPATPTPSPGATGTPTASPTPTATPSTPPTPALPTPQSLLDWHYSVQGIAWPGDNTVTDKNLDRFAAGGLTTTILSSDNVTPNDPDRTPGAAAKLDEHPVLLANSTLSTLFRAAVSAGDDLSWQETTAELSATLALISAQNPSAPRTVLATLGRSNPSFDYRLAQTVDTVQSLPWARSATLSDALAADPVRVELTPKPEAAERLSLTKSMLDSEGSVGLFSSVLTDPTQLTGPRRLALLAALSHAWDADPAGWKDAADQYLADTQTTTTSVQITEGSTINLLAANGNLPITVRNGLNHTVTVNLSVRAQRPILNVLKTRIPLTVEANSQVRALVPVRSIANGQVLLDVSLSSPTGVPVTLPSTVEINVQAGWETVATMIIAGLLVAVFGFGIWRNIVRRLRAKRERANAGEATDPDPVPGPAANPGAAR